MHVRAILWIVCVVAFGAALKAPFHLDDFALLSDPAITAPDGWLECWRFPQTRPLTWFSYWLNFRLGGSEPFGYHLVNLALHLACVWLVADTLSRIIPAPAALTAAILFGLHPIQTEAVVYVFARATLLMTLFCLLSLRAWAAGRHWQAVAWFVPALLAKEECVAFPVFLALLHLSVSRNHAERPPIAAMLALSLAAGLRVMAVAAITPGSGAGVQSGVSTADYFLVQGLAILRYARLLILPYGFTIESPLSPGGGGMAIASWLLIFTGLALAFRWFDKARAGFWLVGAFALLAPSSSIFPAMDLSADRRLYLPMVALGAAAGLAIRHRWLPVALGVLLAAISLRQSVLWTNPEELWREAVRQAPGKVRPRLQLARFEPPARALETLADARRLAPDDARVATETGRVQLGAGNVPAALQEFGRALALAPNDPQALNNRGVALARLGQTEAAAGDFQRALRADPCLADARQNLKRLGFDPPADAVCRNPGRGQ